MTTTEMNRRVAIALAIGSTAELLIAGSEAYANVIKFRTQVGRRVAAEKYHATVRLKAGSRMPRKPTSSWDTSTGLYVVGNAFCGMPQVAIAATDRSLAAIMANTAMIKETAQRV